MAEKSPNTKFSAINDGDGTDAEINRKLTELLKANAVGANSGLPLRSDADAFQAAHDVYPVRILKAAGFGVLQIAGLVTLLILWPIAGLYSFFYDEIDNR